MQLAEPAELDRVGPGEDRSRAPRVQEWRTTVLRVPLDAGGLHQALQQSLDRVEVRGARRRAPSGGCSLGEQCGQVVTLVGGRLALFLKRAKLPVREIDV